MMLQCPVCREYKVNEVKRLRTPRSELKGNLRHVLGRVFKFLKIIPYFFLFVACGLIYYPLFIESNLIYCALAALLLFGMVFWRGIILGMWSLGFWYLSWGTSYLDPSEEAHYIYDRSCSSCGSTWSRRSYETWKDVKLTTKCSKCRVELVTAPSLARSCLYCGSKKIEVLENSQTIGKVESETITQWLERKGARTDDEKQRDLIYALIKDGSPQAVELLAEFVVMNIGGEVQMNVLDQLEKLEDRESIDAVCCVWAATRSEKLSRLLVKHAWVATEPEGVMVFTALKVGHLELAQRKSPEVLEALARACDDEDPVVAERAQQLLIGFDDVELQEALCRLFTKRDYSFARKVAVEHGYAPRDEYQRALFFLITEQWEKYDLLDFDRHLLSTVYQMEPDLQPRIREKLRVSGRIDFLPALVGDNIHRRLSTMTPGEFDLIIQTYSANHEWELLWKLTFDVPYIWSVKTVKSLAGSGWQPERSDDQAVFQELTSLVHQDLLLTKEKIVESFPPISLQAQAKVPGRINAVAFSPVKPVIAVGTGARKVVVWNYQEAKRECVISGFSHSIGHVIYTGNGVLLSGERTNSRSIPCSISGWDSGRQFQLGTHQGSVTALSRVGETQAISAGRDGGLFLWDIPSQRSISQRGAFYATQWVRAMCVSPDSQKAALLHEGVELVELPSLSRVAYGSSKGKKARCAVFLPDGKRIAAGMFNGNVLLFEPSTGTNRLLRNELPMDRHKGKVEGVGVISRQNVLITASYDGEVRLIGLENQEVMGSYEAPLGRVTSLHISPNDDFMVLGNSESLLSFWDLRGLDIQWLLTSSFGEVSLTDLPVLDMALRNEVLPDRAQATLKYAECILRHRFRFDIEVGEVPSIMMGEFDIEID